MKKVLFGLLGIILVLIAVVLVKTLTFESKQYTVKASPAPDAAAEAINHFQQAVRYQTISFGDSALFDSSQFNGFHRFLQATYPNVHQKMTMQKILGYSLLYKWEGKNPQEKPYILMAHQDVVPIEEASKQLWTVDPFGGEVKENFIWGRGTTDDKINLISIMEAAEKLIKEGFQPERTIYLAFGHDEEIGGKGAIATAAWFKANNITAEMVLDEGGIVTTDKVPGVTKPVALIGNSEKGYMSVDLTVEKNGGHSSMPDAETAIDILTRAIVKLRDNPFEARFSEPVEGFVEMLGPEMTFTQKMAFANRWLFESMIYGIYETSGSGNALIRTTLVPTIIHTGMKDNVVPTVAKATVNLRLLPGDVSTDVLAKMAVIIDDERVKLTPAGAVSEASRVTPMDNKGYKKVEMTIKSSYPGVLSAPLLMIGATDSRHFTEVSTDILKFSPMIDPIGFHGIDERVSLESYKTSLWFFENLMRNAN